jgi:thiamine-phosphate pyrophosphorylase
MCLITAPGRSADDDERELLARLAAAARAGVQLIQIRRSDLDGGALARLVEQAILAVRGTSTRVLVNDRVDVALAVGAHGVHLRADSMPAGAVRSLAPPGFVIGRSVHDTGEAVAAAGQGGLDYLLFGTVFATRSKPDTLLSGTEALRTACASVALPVLAIGGMTPSRLGEVARAGAAGFGAIGFFANAMVEALPRVVRDACHAFDTLEAVP